MTWIYIVLCCLFNINYGRMVVQPTLNNEVYEVEVEKKSRENYYTEFGYVSFTLDDFCRGDLINSIISVYSPASIIYTPPYVGFSFSIGGNIFDDIRFVPRDSINSTDLGYSVGTSAPTFNYECLSTNYTLSSFTYYSKWRVTNSINNNSATVNLFSYVTSGYTSYLYMWEITGTDTSGNYVSPVSPITNENLYSVLYENNNTYSVGYSDGYQYGFNEGQGVGYDEGIDVGTEEGLSRGYDYGHSVGYSEGYDDGIAQVNVPSVIFSGILDVAGLPVSVFLTMFQYEIFGINIAGLVSGLVTIAMIIILIRFILGRK